MHFPNEEIMYDLNDRVVAFTPEEGFRVTDQGKTILFHMMNWTKVPLTEDEHISMMDFFEEFSDDFGERCRKHNRQRSKIRANDIPEGLDADVAYKYTDEAGAAFWLQGNIKANPVATYHAIENAHAVDEREGLAHLVLRGPTKDVHITAASGFRASIICCSKDIWKSRRRLMKQKFGERILKINRLQEFCAKLARNIGADRFYVGDINYSNHPIVFAKREYVLDLIRAMSPTGGDLRPEFFSEIPRDALQDMMQLLEHPAIMIKPKDYLKERERRLVFIMPQDTTTPLVTGADPQLAEHIEVVE